jgi:hypothetical protein
MLSPLAAAKQHQQMKNSHACLEILGPKQTSSYQHAAKSLRKAVALELGGAQKLLLD